MAGIPKKVSSFPGLCVSPTTFALTISVRLSAPPTIRNGEDKDIFQVLNFSEDSAETVMMKRQSHDRVREMLQRLPEDQREVIILRHYADMSFKEIAAATDCSINTALGRMRYGLINLRKLMVQKQIAL